MSEQQTIDQIKTRLNKFIEDIDHVIRREGKTSFKISLVFNY